jgi:hypothetical protein
MFIVHVITTVNVSVEQTFIHDTSLEGSEVLHFEDFS